jgi:hypothetical protein
MSEESVFFKESFPPGLFEKMHQRIKESSKKSFVQKMIGGGLKRPVDPPGFSNQKICRKRSPDPRVGA